MTQVIEQMFPRHNNGQIEHHRWCVDLKRAHRLNPLGSKSTSRLQREVEEMAEHFPRWILTVAHGSRLRRCGCGGLLVFDRGLRCVACDAVTGNKIRKGHGQLAWFGLMPPIGIDGLGKIKRGVQRQAPPGHVVGQREEIGTYLLVPLLAVYPDAYPDRPVGVAYMPGIFAIPGMPKAQVSHATHMLGERFMCLFASGQWRKRTTAREVLQQRAYAHVIKLLNYGNGKRDAFAIVS